MDVLIIMCLGILAGHFFKSNRIKKGVEWISLACTFLLILSMGAALGRDENIISDLSSLGLSSVLFFLIPTALSILLVYALTQKFMKSGEDTKEKRDE